MESIRRKEEHWKISREPTIDPIRIDYLKMAEKLCRLTPQEIAEKRLVAILKGEEAQVKTLDRNEKVNEIISDLNSDMKKE